MSSIISKLINLAGNITGILPVANGGTGVASSTGTTNVVLSNGPTLVAPLLGTPASGNLANCTAYPVVVPGTTNGLVSSSGVTGATAGTAIGAGFVGEILSAANAGGAAVGTSPTQLLSITLTAGIWHVACHATQIGGSVQTNFTLGFGTTTASYTGTTQGYTITQGPASAGYCFLCFPLIAINISGSTTYYLNASGSSATGSPSMGCSIYARRVA